MMGKRFTRLCIFFLLTSLLAFLSLLSATVPAHAQTQAYIRIIHASPDAGSVSVFVDGNQLLSNFQFGVITPYVPIPAGAHKVQVGLIGTGLNAPVITESINVSAGTPYTVAAVGTKAAGYALTIFTDNNVVSAQSQSAKVRVYHLSPNAEQANITEGSNKIVNNLTYKTASDYVSVPSGTYTFMANIPMSQSLSLAANLKPWTVTSVFAIGVVNGTPKVQLVSTQVQGVPGMPGTGSDPYAAPSTAHQLSTTPRTIEQHYPVGVWTFVLTFFILLMAACATRHYITRIRV